MRNYSILVIGDEPIICNECSIALTREKYTVESCMSGNIGLSKALENEYDIILLDIRLPDWDGMKILKTLADKRPGSYIIVMTGFSTISNAIQALKAGAFDYLAKPFSNEELVFSVKKAIENKRLKEENIFLRKQIFKNKTKS